MFAQRLDHLGVRLGLPEALIGLLTALAADGPEISSALFALLKGANSVGVGVIVGSNTFNLAAMLGVSGILAGGVWVSRQVLLLEGATAAAITAIAVALLFGWLEPAISAVLAACVIVPYLVILLRARPRAAPPARTRRPSADDPTHHLLALIVLDVTLIVAASAGMVQAAITLGDRWQISQAVLGMLILAPLTSIPNALTGVRLGVGAAFHGARRRDLQQQHHQPRRGCDRAVALRVARRARRDRRSPGRLARGDDRGDAADARPRGAGCARADAWVLIVLYGGFVVTQLVSAEAGQAPTIRRPCPLQRAVRTLHALATWLTEANANGAHDADASLRGADALNTAALLDENVSPHEEWSELTQLHGGRRVLPHAHPLAARLPLPAAARDRQNKRKRSRGLCARLLRAVLARAAVEGVGEVRATIRRDMQQLSLARLPVARSGEYARVVAALKSGLSSFLDDAELLSSRREGAAAHRARSEWRGRR